MSALSTCLPTFLSKDVRCGGPCFAGVRAAWGGKIILAAEFLQVRLVVCILAAEKQQTEPDVARKKRTPKEIMASLERALDHTAMPEADGYMKRMKRPRIEKKGKTHPNKGGWRGHPNSLLALELHRAKGYFRAPGRKPCKVPGCTQTPVKGLNVCMMHGGRAVQLQRRIADNCARYSRPAEANRVVRRLVRGGELPVEFLRTSIWRAVDGAYADLIHRHPGSEMSNRTPELIAHINALKMLRFELVRAWFALAENDDHGPWTAAVGKAKELGLFGP